MIALSSAADVLTAVEHAQSVALSAYVLRPGRMLDALESAARRGTHVTVRLETLPYGDKTGGLERLNARAVTMLRSSGADAQLVDRDGKHPLHMKAAQVDGNVYLNDRNWPDDGPDTIVRDTDSRDVRAVRQAIDGDPRDDAPLATKKARALRLEERTIYGAISGRSSISVESESFGFGRVYAALAVALRLHLKVRVLVARSDVNSRSAAALWRLARRGADVRLSQNDEKLAVSARCAWIGSANATAGMPDQVDWGMRVSGRGTVTALQQRFEQNWNAAVPYNLKSERAFASVIETTSSSGRPHSAASAAAVS